MLHPPDNAEPLAAIASLAQKKRKHAIKLAPPREGWNNGRNLWRFQSGSGDTVVEMLLGSGHVFLIDADRYTEIAPFRWRAVSPKEKQPYVQTNMMVGEKETTIALHIFLFPDIDGERDHINCNPLDNRRSNMENGANGANQRNRSTITGVTTDHANKSYRALWTEFGVDGTTSKSFAWSKYPSKEAAYTAAEKYSAEQRAIALAQVRAHNKEHGGKVPIPKRERAKKIISKTGIVGLTVRNKDSPYETIIGQLKINGKKFNAGWAISLYGGRDAATRLGEKWVADVRAANPKNAARRGKRLKVGE
jgi:hypothetical protein